MCLHALLLLAHHHHLSLRCYSCPARPRPGLRLAAASCLSAAHLRVAAERPRGIARNPGCSWPSRGAARSAASRRRSCWSDVKMTRAHETSSGTCPDTVLLPAARLGCAGLGCLSTPRCWFWWCGRLLAGSGHVLAYPGSNGWGGRQADGTGRVKLCSQQPAS